MDNTTIIIGAVIVLFGLYTTIVRIKTPGKLTKLIAMKEKFGNSKGVIIHTIAYSIVPMLFGAVVIYAGTQGMSIMQFIAA